jgi:DNA-binding CsgD family transcriptional regulator
MACEGLLDPGVQAGIEQRGQHPSPIPGRSRWSGGALRRTRHRYDAGKALQESVDIFTALGALTWQQLATEELHRALPGRGDSSLTPTEAAIAGLAAKGHTNQEIAHQLIISIKTVEANLTKIYAKLGVRSRTGLAHLNLE